MPKSRKDAKHVAIASQDYMLLDLLLFKIVPDKIRDELMCVLCIPTSKVDILLDAYHSSLIGGHAGITKCYLTISKCFYCLNLSNHIRAYITRCHVCQLLKAGPRFDRPYHKRININVPALTKISMWMLWYASLMSTHDRTSHLDLPSILKMSHKRGVALLQHRMQVLSSLKSTIGLLSRVTFLVISMTGEV